MPDIHARLTEVITRRLEVARAATPGPWSPDKPWLSDVVTSALLGAVADCSIGTGYRAQSLEDARHIALHDPDDAIRRYERDLRVLERHAAASDEPTLCRWCLTGTNDDDDDLDYLPHPCPDYADLLTVYPEARETT